jgi:hypothetical protein
MDVALGKRIISLRNRIVASNFNEANWAEVGLLTGHSAIISGHPRLLRSLSWGDEDYDGNVLWVLEKIATRDQRALKVIEDYVTEKFPGEDQAEYVSSKPSERKITFAPNVFQVPDGGVEPDLVAVMMPFAAEFSRVFETIKRACSANAMRCVRADAIWDESTIIQDIFNLIFKAQVVVVDFTGKNPNVMYETGIAHTLGKHVVPLTQSLDDVPFDMRHHRALKYLANDEGLRACEVALTAKLNQLSPPPAPLEEPEPARPTPDPDEIPF